MKNEKPISVAATGRQLAGSTLVLVLVLFLAGCNLVIDVVLRIANRFKSFRILTNYRQVVSFATTSYS